MLIRSVIIGVAVIGFGLSDFEFISLNFVQFFVIGAVVLLILRFGYFRLSGNPVISFVCNVCYSCCVIALCCVSVCMFSYTIYFPLGFADACFRLPLFYICRRPI